jgi:uroporphyrinogen decarboxylase
VSSAAKMTSRERVRCALNHQEPDRVPLDLVSTGNTGITAIAYRRLLTHLGIESGVVVWDRMQQLAVPDERVLLRLGIDTRGIWLNAPDKSQARELEDDSYADEWGVVRSRPPGGFYYDLVRSPLPGTITKADLDAFDWPNPDDPGRYRGIRERARRIHEETPYALVVHGAPGFITRAQYLRGFEDWFMDVVAEPEFAADVLDRCLAISLRINERLLEEVGEYADVVMLGDDIGVQDGPMVSPSTYRSLIKPRQAQYFASVHKGTDAKLLYHTCGSVVDLLDDLIEIGVDVLNPVQVTARGMDPAALKARFGDRLSFWGGVDTQSVLPWGTPDEVRAEVRKRVAALGPGGGYVVDAVHNVQADVSAENIVARFEEAASYGTYPLK